MKTIQDAAKEALIIQNACNLSGIIHSWEEIMSIIWIEAKRQKQGTDWINKHPINKIIAYKVYDLTGYPCSDSGWFTEYKALYSEVATLGEILL